MVRTGEEEPVVLEGGVNVNLKILEIKRNLKATNSSSARTTVFGTGNNPKRTAAQILVGHLGVLVGVDKVLEDIEEKR